MMATDTIEKKATKSGQAEPEHLPCPRCDSTNTKFCYYNNYNFSQPRHFCKACRRYWTHGGTLRDIPIGGGTRKNAKRCRTSSAPTAYHRDFRHLPVPFSANHAGAMPVASDGKMGGGFTTLLNSAPPNGVLALGGFGVGLDDVLGRATWPFAAVVDGGATAVSGGVPAAAGHRWQMEGGENGFVAVAAAAAADSCFALPDLAISTPGNYFK